MSAHFEHTFTLTPNGAWILTAIDGGEQKLGELGVPFGGTLGRRPAVAALCCSRTRAEDAAADNEYAAFLGFTGPDESPLQR